MNFAARSTPTKIAIVAAGIVFVFLIALLSLGLERYTPLVDRVLIEEAKRNNIKLIIPKSRLSWGGYSLVGAEALPMRVPVIVIEQLEVGPVWQRLLILDLWTQITGVLYGGLLEGLWDIQLEKQSARGSFTLRDLGLERIPTLAFIGIYGTLSAKGTNVILNNSSPAATLALSIKDGGLRTPIKLSSIGLALPLEIPSFDDLMLESNISFDTKHFNLSKLEIQSSLLKLNGSGRARALGPNPVFHGPASLQFDFEVSLSVEFLEQFSGFLPLISNNQLTKDSRSFKLKLSGSSNRPQTSFVPL